MKSDQSEYSEIIRKLLEKTRQRKVAWSQGYSGSFSCTLAADPRESLQFDVSEGSEKGFLTLRMSDQYGNEIFAASSNDLPTSPAEEEVSQMIEEIYARARRQALKIEQKLELASALLDQV